MSLDLSLVETGLCHIPPDWDGLYKNLVTKSIHSERREAFGDVRELASAEVERCHEIAESVLAFIEKSGVRDVCIEQYKLSPMQKKGKGGRTTSFMSPSTSKLIELGGIVKSQIYLALGIPTVPVVASSARKWLIGKLKQKGQKAQAQAYLRALHFHFDNEHEGDAFVVGNFRYDKINELRSRFSKQVNLDL